MGGDLVISEGQKGDALPRNAEVMNVWSYTSTSATDFMAWYSVKHRRHLHIFIVIHN
jgi:hypothetical protein